MIQAFPSLLAVSWRDKLAAMSLLELVLWVGLAALTLALLVLVGTRWGQQRPVSKCVALSVFAHILFLCYAYGTRLSISSGSLLGDPFVRVSFVGSEGDGDLPVVGEPANSPESLAVTTAPDTDNPATSALVVSDAATPEPADAPPGQPPLPATEESPVSNPPPPVTQVAPDPPPPVSPPADVAQESANSVPERPATPTAENDIQIDVPPVPELVTAVPTDKRPAVPTQPASDAVDPRPEPIAETAVTSNSGPTTAPSEIASVEQPQAMARPVDGQAVPEPYRLRGAPDRLRFAIPFGASEQSEAAVAAALDWMAAQQLPDGRWDASAFGAGRETRTLGQDRQGAGADADTGISGLALLAYLGAGHTHASGTHRETVQHGLEFLLRTQLADGSLVGDAKLYERMYCHGIASVALGEAYAMSGDPRLVPALRRAVQFTLTAQDRVSGGWRYQPGDRGDMSQFGWQVMALRSAALGGLVTPADNRELMLKFLDSATQGRHRGLASYRPGSPATRTMTAEALTCRVFLDLPLEDAQLKEASDFLLQELPGQEEPNLYYWYYATLALFQNQDEAWKTWNEQLQRTLLARQRRDGVFAGSWDTRDVWGGYGGRIYTTAMAALCLEVYYRYLPLYDPTQSVRHAEADPNALRR